MWNAYKTQNAALIGRDARFNDLQVDGDFVLNSSPVGSWTPISCVLTAEDGVVSNITCRYSKIGKITNLWIPFIDQTIGVTHQDWKTLGLPAAIKPDATLGVGTVQAVSSSVGISASPETVGSAVINTTSEMQLFARPDRASPASPSKIFQCIVTYIGE